MHVRVYLFLLCSFSFATAKPGDCPFNDSNSCYCKGVSGNVIESLTCNPRSGNYTPVPGPAGVYTVTGSFIISANGIDLILPANAFTAFASITLLDIIQKGSYSRNLILDPSAFNGTSVLDFSASGFQNLLPLLPGVKNLGTNGLKELSLLGCYPPTKSLTLIANDFTTFKNLTSLYFGYLTIDEVLDDAFAGLENSLLTFQFEKVIIPNFPGNALNRLRKLIDIQLTHSSIEAFPAAAFSSFSNLRNLFISGPSVSVAVKSKALDNFPSSVQQLSLVDSSLTKVPNGIPLAVPWLSLSHNPIHSVGKGDFPPGNNLQYLSLGYSFLSEIDPEALQELKLVRDFELQESKFKVLDLVIFNGMDELRNVSLFADDELENATVSAPEKVPTTLEVIDLSWSSSLQRVDSSLQAVLDRATFKLLDISYAPSFICDDGALWLAKYVLCDTKRVNTVYTMCANLLLKSIDDWLAEQVSNPCE